MSQCDELLRIGRTDNSADATVRGAGVLPRSVKCELIDELGDMLIDGLAVRDKILKSTAAGV